MPLFGEVVDVPLVGVHVRFEPSSAGVSGKLDAGLPLCPARAALLPLFTRFVQAAVASGGADAQTWLATVPCGEACVTANGHPPVAGDGRIDPCEIGRATISTPSP